MKNNWLIRLFTVMNTLLITSVNNAQNTPVVLIEELMEELSVNNDEEREIDWTDEIEELSQRMEQPVQLNSATREQLESIPFLNDRQIENLLAYLYIHGPMQTIYELQLVEGMDQQTIQYLLPFVAVGTIDKKTYLPSLKNVWKYGKSEALARMDVPFYTRKGYEKTYLGPALYHSLRYGFRYQDNLYVGFSAEKDAGEPFGALHNTRGYDYYSFYLLLQNIGRLKTLAVGNYRLSFGQGLVISTDYWMGKTAYLSSFTFRSTGIRKHASTDEYNYFRGAATAVALSKSFTLSAFYSHRSMDGVMKNDEITSIYKSGLHRSKSEAEKRETFSLQLAGGNLSYRNNNLKIGATGIYYAFNRPYEPVLKTYAKYNLHGSSFYNLGIDYSYRWHQLSFQGETAIGTKGMAALHKIQYTPVQGTQLMLLHRYYAHDYWAFFANSFGESSQVQNENGWYLAAETAPFSHWRFFASMDLFSFPWWKYRISKPSQGVDLMLQATYSPRKNVNMYLNYRYKRKERDVSGTQGEVTLPVYQQRLRYRLNYDTDHWFSLRTTLDGNRFQTKGKQPGYGYQATQAVSCRLPWFPLQATLQGSYFRTDDYDSRVYIAEKGLLYTFYTPSFQGEGLRFSVHLRYDINKHWMMIAKLGQTQYEDRQEIGSGYDLIPGNKKADMQMQLRLKF
ncbi:MAG: helix-hairpin-helix domain-containing protein [Bacteroides sp.]